MYRLRYDFEVRESGPILQTLLNKNIMIRQEAKKELKKKDCNPEELIDKLFDEFDYIYNLESRVALLLLELGETLPKTSKIRRNGNFKKLTAEILK